MGGITPSSARVGLESVHIRQEVTQALIPLAKAPARSIAAQRSAWCRLRPALADGQTSVQCPMLEVHLGHVGLLMGLSQNIYLSLYFPNCIYGTMKKHIKSQ